MRDAWQRVASRAWPGVVSRMVAAVAGGYAIAALVTVAASLLLPFARVDAVLTGMMLSFLGFACAVLWVFAARTAWRAWLGLLAPGLMLAAASWAGWPA